MQLYSWVRPGVLMLKTNLAPGAGVVIIITSGQASESYSFAG
jgi:hypothetical protein